MKLEHQNYPRRLPHAKFDFDPTTWVVWANAQFATVRFLCFLFLVYSSRAQVAPVDRF